MSSSRVPLVVPTDFSPAASEALAYAVRIAEATASPLHLLHVLSWPDAGPFEVPGDAPTATEEEAEEEALVQASLAREASGLPATLPVTTAIRRGGPAALEIVAYAQEVQAHLVVIGRCGRRPRRQGLGAVAAEVLEESACDVLLVPHREAQPFSASTPQSVLIPTDFSSAAHRLVSYAVDWACALAPEAPQVSLVHVLEPLPHPVRWIDETVVDLVPQIRRRAGEALRALADEALAMLRDAGDRQMLPEIDLYVERGKAVRTIPRVAEALEADLIVLGPHAERPLFDRLLGSVADGVARRSDRPVLIARRSAAPDPTDEPPVDAESYHPEAAAPDEV